MRLCAGMLVLLLIRPVNGMGGQAEELPPAAPADSVLRLIDLWSLPRLDALVVNRQFASTDPTGRGHDHGNFLKLEGRRAVLGEMQGPGVIARLWSANAQGRLRVFFDGEDEPRIDAPFQEIFQGKVPPFVEPLATHRGGGWICYFPIPYQESCRVEVDELDNPGALYYQVQYLTYPPDAKIRSFTTDLPPEEREHLDRVLKIWGDSRNDPLPPSKADKAHALTAKLEPGAESILFSESGPGLVTLLSIRPDPATPSVLRGLLLEAHFDDVKGPCVSAPLGDFFGVGFGATTYAGLALGWQEDGGYCRFAMPYRKAARIVLRNSSRQTVSFRSTVVARPLPKVPEDFGLFHAEFRSVDPVGRELYEFASMKGPGKYVGVNLALQGVGDLWYLEGNEQLFVDGEEQPSILGTGTEDFFNGGWYWDRGTLAMALHGLGIKEEWTTNRTTPYRMQVPDAVPFEESLVARIEHGSANQVLDGYYSSVAYWYARGGSVRTPAEAELNVPRLWVKRPRNALAAADWEWSPKDAVTTGRWEQLSPNLRGVELALYQGFPVSFFERDQQRLNPEILILKGANAEAGFSVEEGDRYRVSLRVVGRPGGPIADVLIDGKKIGRCDPGASDVAPKDCAEFDRVALAAGRHRLQLQKQSEGAAGSDDWLGIDSITLESAAPFVRCWWIAPPVDPDPQGTVEQTPEVEARFLASDFDPASAGWKEAPETSEHLDLNHWVGSKAPVFGYLLTLVHSPQARTARARLGSDDGVRMWVNGQLVWSHALHRHFTPDEDRFDVQLSQGWNRILVKVRNDDGGYALSLRLCDPDGTLRFTTRPQ